MRAQVTSVLAAAGLAGAAEAAPWVRDAGGWYGRTLVARDTLDGAEGWRTDGYAEYGVSDRWTVTAKAEAVTYDGFEEFGREAFRLTLRRELFGWRDWTAGAEAGPVYGNTATGFSGCGGLGFETRAGLGRSWLTREGRASYLFGDIAYIAQEDGCERQRAEIGYGADLTPRVFVKQQVWIEEGNKTADSLKLENQIGVHFQQVDVSLGYREEFGGQFEETAILIALVARR